MWAAWSLLLRSLHGLFCFAFSTQNGQFLVSWPTVWNRLWASCCTSVSNMKFDLFIINRDPGYHCTWQVWDPLCVVGWGGDSPSLLTGRGTALSLSAGSLDLGGPNPSCEVLAVAVPHDEVTFSSEWCDFSWACVSLRKYRESFSLDLWGGTFVLQVGKNRPYSAHSVWKGRISVCFSLWSEQDCSLHPAPSFWYLPA